jgi:RNA polymerase sigma-54 factor
MRIAYKEHSFMMHMEHRLAQTQTQRLMLTQKMQQAIQILQLSALELEQYVQQELETNPVIEAVQVEPDPSPVATETPTDRLSDQVDDTDWGIDEYMSPWHKEGRDLSVNPDLAARRDYYENSITREESFTSKLLDQLHMAADDPKRLAIGEQIIGEIDNRGYFTGNIEEIARENEASVEETERVLYLVQRFEPTGVGARDIVECLLLQIAVEFPDEPELSTLVSDHLEALQYRKIPEIATAMNVTAERVEELAAKLSRLNPWPGHEYSGDPPHYVAPDVIVDRDEETGEYIVYMARDGAPRLGISDAYRKMVRQDGLGRTDRQYLRDKLESARWLIRNIEQRQNTIERIARAIVEVQRDFFDRGVEFIKPLTLQEIADRVGVHEATVSRTTRGKYMQTPQGLFEMKYFFSPGLRSDNGESQSSKSVQSLIKKIIEEEDKAKPLSDQKIADLLKKRDGVTIARRTVTKYREGMGILSTTMRKQY